MLESEKVCKGMGRGWYVIIKGRDRVGSRMGRGTQNLALERRQEEKVEVRLDWKLLILTR